MIDDDEPIPDTLPDGVVAGVERIAGSVEDAAEALLGWLDADPPEHPSPAASSPPQRVQDLLTPCRLVDVAAALRDGTPDLGEPGRRLLLAHSAFETGWWQKIHCYNFGNAKARPGWGGDWTYFACTEVLGGRVVWFYPDDPACCFRAFPDLAAGMRDYLALLRHRFAAAWPAIVAGDAVAFCAALKLQGYYTDPIEHYTASVVSVLASVNRQLV